MRAYATDNDDALPAAATWCDDLTPYLSTEQYFICPLERGGRASYAMSQWLSQTQIDRRQTEAAGVQFSVVDPLTGDAVGLAEALLLFDGPEGWNVSGGPDEVRYRHNGGANFGFVDGHCRWIGEHQIHYFRWPQYIPSTSDTGQPARP